jgi:hypothetical protein
MCDHSHLKNERGDKNDSRYQRHYPNGYAALENHWNMDVINIILCEYDYVKRKFLYYHDKDYAYPYLHVSHLFLLRARDHLRFKLDEHDAEEAIENADEATHYDARDDIVVEDANVKNGVLGVAKAQKRIDTAHC